MAKPINQLPRDVTDWAAKQVLRASHRIAAKLQTSMQQNITLTDHSFNQLAKMGHPYAVANPKNIHEPPWLVHEQSGKLSDAQYNRIDTKKDSVIVLSGIDSDQAPHVGYVVHGTSKMVSRNFIKGTLDQITPDVDKILQEEVGPKQ